MAVNLTNNRLPLLAAYHDVISEESPTDWALYTYEDDTDNLTVASSGGGGLLDIVLHFDNQRVMYGFCSIKEPHATLPRYILINWVGEDVPDARKCACASHVATIAEFLQGVDIIVNASSAEDIDPGAIAQRLSNGTIHVASPVLHRLRLREEENPETVGTTYQKTDATLEMKQINREQFWEQAKREEELRKEEERKRAVEERLKFEQERMELERKEQEERERRYREREQQIEEHRKRQQTLEAEEAQKRLRDKSIFEDQADEEERLRATKIESEVEEAAAIIAQRTDNPREFFKQQEKAVSGSFDSAPPLNNRTAGRLGSPFLKTQYSLPERSCSPPRTPFPHSAPHYPLHHSFPLSNRTDSSPGAVGAVRMASDASVTATPIYEENEEAVEEVTSETRQRDLSMADANEDVFSSEVQQKEEILSPALGRVNGVESEKPKDSMIDNEQPFREWKEEPRPEEHVEESSEIYAEESSLTQSQNMGWANTLHQDTGPVQTGDTGPLHMEDLGFMDTEVASAPTAKLQQQQDQSLVQLDEPVGTFQQESTQQKTENLLDLWESESRHEPSWTSPEGLEPALLDTGLPSKPDGDNVPMLVDVEEVPHLPEGFQLPPENIVGALSMELRQEVPSSLIDDNILNMDDLPEPPSTFCDMDQEENPPSIIDIEGPHQMTLSYQRALQEASETLDSEPDFGDFKDDHTMANGETTQKDGTQASEGYFSQSQEEEFHQPEESSAKVPPPPAFYNKPPEIDITCWDNDPVAEDDDYGAAD